MVREGSGGNSRVKDQLVNFSLDMLKCLFVCFAAGNNSIFASVLLPQSSKCEVIIFPKQSSPALCDGL